jgi:hypothetical protein
VVELEQASASAGRAPRFAHLEAAAGVGASRLFLFLTLFAKDFHK